MLTFRSRACRVDSALAFGATNRRADTRRITRRRPCAREAPGPLACERRNHRCGGDWPWNTTRSSSARAAPVRRPPCCSPGRATRSWSSIAPRSRATRCRPARPVHPVGVAALARWGLLERLAATGCPPIDTYAFDFGPFTIAGSPGTADSPVAYCPRRTVLDKLLVDAAAEAGAEVREGFTVDEVADRGRPRHRHPRSWQGRRQRHRARQRRHRRRRPPLARRRGRAARAVQREAAAPGRLLHATGAACRWTGASRPTSARTAASPRCRRTTACTLVIAGWPYAEFEANKSDIEGNYLKVLELAPAVRGTASRRQARSARSPARPCRTSSASPSAPAGRSSATRATTRIRSRRRASRTPSATPSAAPSALDEAFRGRAAVRRRPGRLPARARRARRCRCTSSPASWRRCSLRRRRCSSCSARSTATQRAMDDFVQDERRHDLARRVLCAERVGAMMAAASVRN